MHSFTPVYRGAPRPWHVGIVSTRERRLADAMLAALRREPGLVVGDNEPYSPKDNVDYTIRRHGRDRGLPHVMIEIRNDLLRAAKGVAEWAERLTDALRSQRRLRRTRSGAGGAPAPRCCGGFGIRSARRGVLSAGRNHGEWEIWLEQHDTKAG